MKQITIFAMTKKGYTTVRSIHTRHPGLIDKVVGSRDAGLVYDYFDELAVFCQTNNIAFFERHASYSIETEYALAVSWRWIIDLKSSRLIVFHDSLLPRYRGFNPLVTALINGDKEIGVTALYATSEYDKGDIIAQSSSYIHYPITISDAIETILANYSSLAEQISDFLARDEQPSATPQAEEDATYSLWRDEEDYFIDWTCSAETIKRFIDAVGFPYKGAASTLDGKVVRLLSSEVVDDVKIENRTPGKVIFVDNSRPVVVCGKGLLRIDSIADASGCSCLPLQRFRTRFKGRSEHWNP